MEFFFASGITLNKHSGKNVIKSVNMTVSGTCSLLFAVCLMASPTPSKSDC